jgi:hypothetical protein
MGIWDVKSEKDREQWTFDPFVSVGPLRFGMSPDEVAAALSPAFRSSSLSEQPRNGTAVHVEDQFADTGVTVYYDRSAQVDGIAIDSRSGPQVVFGGIALVGRVPSEAENWLFAYTQARDLDFRYTHAADPLSPDLGLMLRVQRAGDVVLTRPVFMVREWTEVPWDHVPQSEWNRF